MVYVLAISILVVVLVFWAMQARSLSSAPARPRGTPPVLVGIDVETTGLNPGTGRIVRIAVIRMSPRTNEGRVAYSESARLVGFVNPEHRMGGTKIHHITGEAVKDAPVFSALASKLRELMDGAVVVGHNVDFDLGFLRASFARAGIAFPRIEGAYCTLANARRKLRLRDYKLSTCCAALDIPYSPHEAESDATAALLLAGRLTTMA